MQIKHKLPPNHNQIKQVLKTTEYTIYCYGDIIYNPSGLPLTDDLEYHESIHAHQQKLMGVEEWWEKYLEDKRFRLEQEIEAYKLQMEYADEHYDRPKRREIKKEIIKNLSSDLYGKLLTKKEVKEILEKDKRLRKKEDKIITAKS